MTALVIALAIHLAGVFVLGFIHGRDNPDGTPPTQEQYQAIFAWPFVLVMMAGAWVGIKTKRKGSDA